MAKLIKSTNLKNSHLMDFFNVMELISTRLDTEDLEVLKIKNEVAQFKQVFSKLDESLSQARKTGYTQKLIDADNLRDNLVIGLKYVILGMTYFSDNDLSDKAEQVKITIDKYGKRINRLSQREESGVIHNLLQDLEKEPIASILTQLGAAQWVPKLKVANDAFQQLYLERGVEEAKFVTGLTREQRADMEDAFEHLCEVINAYAVIVGKEPYQPLADYINNEVEKVKALAKSRQTLSEE